MRLTVKPFRPTRFGGAMCALMAAGTLPARGDITSVVANTSSVAKYAKLELTVGLSSTYANPYDPDEAELSAEFISPTKKAWKVNGFYDGNQWKVRFAANEIGDWTYVVTAKDARGTAQSQAQTFACKESPLHGWVRVAPNKRYLAYDDGPSFFGVGSCHAWGVTTNTLDQMKALGFNTYVYWNGTYDQGGGNQLIESLNSGLGKYDQRKCTRLDTLIEWTEARDMAMIFVLLPHDYASENINGWPSKWTLSPYSTQFTSDTYYSDEKSWSYQLKQYRYIIARWGYSRALLSWQTVDEISGTNGWRANQAAANKWTADIGKYFQTNDPFHHPTTASEGGFWDEGNKVNDLPNTEIYGNYQTYNVVATVQRLWNNYEKPCIMGETGTERDGESAHRRLWCTLASGIAVTPLLWQFNQGWNASTAAQYPAFNKFIADIDFAHLKNLTQARLTIPGTELPKAPPGGRGRGGRGTNPATARGPASEPATAPATATAPAIPVAGAYGITSDQLTFGWITGDIGRRKLRAALPNGSYKIEWWNTTAGTVVATHNGNAADGTLELDIPDPPPPPVYIAAPTRGGTATTPAPAAPQPDMAFKIIPSPAR